MRRRKSLDRLGPEAAAAVMAMEAADKAAECTEMAGDKASRNTSKAMDKLGVNESPEPRRARRPSFSERVGDFLKK